MTHLSLDRARQLLDYDPGTGVLTWKVNRGKARIGAPAGAVTDVGKGMLYQQLGIDGHSYYAQQIAFLMGHGRWPLGMVIFRDGDSSNFTLKNLEEVDAAAHQWRTSRIQKNNRSGYPGVAARSNGRFEVKIKADGERFYVGSYKDPELAYLQYAVAAMVRDKLRGLNTP